MTNARDAFDDWHATEPAALHNLTIAEIWMAAYDQGQADERELHQPDDDPEPPAVKCYGCGQTYQPTEYGSAEHARHLGDSGAPRDILISWLDKLQAERDRWIRVAGDDPEPEPGPHLAITKPYSPNPLISPPGKEHRP